MRVTPQFIIDISRRDNWKNSNSNVSKCSIRYVSHKANWKAEEMNQDFERLKDKTSEPTEETVIKFIGKQTSKAWIELRQFIEENYDFKPEIVFYGNKYGWTVRYRKSGRTLCSLFPEKGAFTVLIVLGKKEVDKVVSISDDLSPRVRKMLSDTEQLHDGTWLWIRLMTIDDVDDIVKLLTVKRKPKKVQ